MYCIKCGNKLTNNDIYCPNCGTKKEENNSSNNKNKEQTTDTLAIALSIISIITFYFPIISIPLAVAAIINGKKYYKETNNKTNATTISIISIILSVLYIILIIGIVIIMFFYYDNKTDIEDNNYKDYIEEKYRDWYNDIEEDDVKIELAGHKWQGTDSSVLYLEEDKTYNWYLDKYNYNDNFHGGNYEYYTGYKAIKYIVTNFPEYNLTEENQLEIFKSDNYNINNYIVLILNCEYSKIDGRNQTDAAGTVVYRGIYYEKDKKMSLINMKSNNSAEFKMIEETEADESNNIV